jgi:hypothetical protein
MWFRRRRRRQPPPVLLPSLDRLAELIERVVALLDQLQLAPSAVPEEIVLKQHKPEPVSDGWVALVASPDGYRLLQRQGRPPDCGTAVELEGVLLVVLRLGPSPLPGDRRRCAYLEQEPPSVERNLDR